MDDVLFHQKARETLARILRDDGYLGNTRMEFDYTQPKLHPESHRPWEEWKHGYFQRVTVPGAYIIPIDGISACLGQFDFRALAAGYTIPLENGGHKIVIENVSIYLWDSFNFHKEDELGYWSCEKKSFKLFDIPLFEDKTYLQVYNTHFIQFRNKYGQGEDFMVLSYPKPVDYLSRFQYETTL